MSIFAWFRRRAAAAEVRWLNERKRVNERMARQMIAEYHAAQIALTKEKDK